MRFRRLMAVVILMASLNVARAASPGQWIVVTAPAYRAALEPLCQQRRHQGFQVVVVQTSDDLSDREIATGEAGKLRAHVNRLCRATQDPSYVLLVGAVTAGRGTDAARTVLPPLPGTIGRMKGEPSDNGYGCPGEGVLPTVPVGRLPARTEEECRAMVAKILDSERDQRPGPWHRRLSILAGVPAYNPLVDRLVESLALSRFDRIHPSWSGRAIYHNAASRFCVPDELLHERALQLVQDGQAFTLYLGHSSAEGFYAGQARYLDRIDWATLRINHSPGVFATFGCNGCQLRGPDGEGYGVAAIRNPNGPVAVLGSHGICFAAMVELAAGGLCDRLLVEQPPERLGDAWLGLEAGLAQGKMDGFTFKLLDAVDGDSSIPLEMQRLEHMQMFVLLGDPALKLPLLPVDLKLTAPEVVHAGQTLAVQGQAPARLEGARVHLTLERPVSSEPNDLQPLPEQGPDRSRVMLANHERANRFVLASAEATVRNGNFEGTLEIPGQVPWKRLTLRAYAATEREEGLGVSVLRAKME